MLCMFLRNFSLSNRPCEPGLVHKKSETLKFVMAANYSGSGCSIYFLSQAVNRFTTWTRTDFFDLIPIRYSILHMSSTISNQAKAKSIFRGIFSLLCRKFSKNFFCSAENLGGGGPPVSPAKFDLKLLIEFVHIATIEISNMLTIKPFLSCRRLSFL